jgi:tripartite-type tricarboxylate transporter receptor subunit TctC
MIRLVRRTAHALRPAIALLAVSGSPAAAQTPDSYPARELHVICAFPPGSGADVWVRFFAQQVGERAGQPVVVENRPGANGNIATEYLARARPDGYTILIHSPTSIAANKFMLKNTPADLDKSIVTVATLFKFAPYLTVGATRRWKNVQEMVAYLRQRADRASFSASSPTGRLTGNLFKEALQLNAVEILNRTSADVLYDLQIGRLDFAFTDSVFARAQASEQNLKILAVAAHERMKSDTTIPTLEEQGVPGLDVQGFFGVMAPAGTPRPVVSKINGWIVDVVGQRLTREFISNFGADPLIATPDQAERMFLDSFREWGRLVKLARIKPEH